MTVILVLLAHGANSTTAQGAKLQFGDLAIVPGLSLSAEHDDNIYLGNGDNTREEQETSDWIMHVIPSISLDFKLPDRGTLAAGYMADLAYYDDNDDNDWKRHVATLLLDYTAPGGIILGVDNEFVHTEDPYSSENEFALGVPQVKRWYDDLNTKVGYDFSDQFKLLGYYNFYKQNYDDEIDFSQDYKSDEFGAGAAIRLFPQTWGFLRYHYGQRDYFTHPKASGVTSKNDADFDWHRANAGLTWDATAKLSGELNLGYQWKNYDNRADVEGNKYDDKETWIASTYVTFEATPLATLSTSLTRALRDTGSDTNEYFEDTGAGLNLAYVFREKFTFNVGGSYAYHDYNEPKNKKRNDNNYRGAIGVDYEIQDWISVGTMYQYWEKDSNYSENDFEDNRFTFKVSFVY